MIEFLRERQSAKREKSILDKEMADKIVANN